MQGGNQVEGMERNELMERIGKLEKIVEDLVQTVSSLQRQIQNDSVENIKHIQHSGQPDLSGWMSKLGNYTGFQRRYFMLYKQPPACIYYFQNDVDAHKFMEGHSSSQKGRIEIGRHSRLQKNRFGGIDIVTKERTWSLLVENVESLPKNAGGRPSAMALFSIGQKQMVRRRMPRSSFTGTNKLRNRDESGKFEMKGKAIYLEKGKLDFQIIDHRVYNSVGHDSSYTDYVSE